MLGLPRSTHFRRFHRHLVAAAGRSAGSRLRRLGRARARALAPVLAPTLVLRLALTVPASLTALWVAFDTPAPDDKPGFFVPVAERFADGLNGYFNVAVPFSGIERMKMHGVVVLAIFGFCLVLGHAIAARRPLRGGPGGGGRGGLGSDPVPLARRPLRRVDPRRRPLGARRPADDASDPARRRRCSAHSRRGGGIDLGCGREERRHRVGRLGTEPHVRRGDLGQLCVGRPVRRHPVLEEGDELSCGSRVRSVVSTGGRRRSISSTPTAGSTIRFRSPPASPPAGCRTTRCCRPARWTGARG